MKVILWYVPESETLRYIIADDIQITRRNNIDFVELPNGVSTVVDSGRVHADLRAEKILIGLYLSDVGEIVLLREAGIDRIAFIYEDSELDAVIAAIPELKGIRLGNEDVVANSLESTPQEGFSTIDR